MQVIDIPSSPEPSMRRRTRSASRQPGPSKKRPRIPARESSIIEVIELSDSDSDPPVRRSRRRQSPAKTTHTFGIPSADILADAPASASGSSHHAPHQEPQTDHAPLFLPGSDDERDPARPGPVAQDTPDHHSEPAPPQLDPVDGYISRVLEIVPDVQPAHALALIEQFMQAQPGNVVEFVLHALFENPSYPQVDKKGKHKRSEPDGDGTRGSPKPDVDYANKDRPNNCGPYYFERSLEQLMTDFPRIPKPHIRSRLLENRFYAPTYLLLADELKKQPLPFRLKSSNSVVGKGKARQDPEFDKEREWVLLKIAEQAAERDAALAASVNEHEYEENGQGIECGCCFSEYSFDQMIQCPEAHLFCKSCMTSYASNLLGEHNPNIVCMDQSGCILPFPESELSRFLSSKLLELYFRVKQRKDIEAAGLENLEECPFCDYRCVIENEMEKLFRCENVDCNAITCRACKKPDHLPKSCKEIEEDKHLDAQHLVEEAMTQALMRNCPKCQKSFIKEMGCNKMTCPNCHTVSCYICRMIINGYDHFSNSGKANKGKCSLWDPVEQRSAEEVSEAAKRALADLRQSRPDVDGTNIKVDLPVAQAPPRPGAVPHRQAVFGLNGVAGVPPYIEAGAVGWDGMPIPIMHGWGMGGAGVGGHMGGVPAGAGAGAGMVGAPLAGGAGAGLANNPFMFGAGQAHPFDIPPALRAMMGAQAVAPPVHVPLAQQRGRRAPRARAPVNPAQAQPVMPAGGGGRRRRGR